MSDSYLSLDQGMIMAAIGNALGHDVLRRAFATHDVERELRPVIGVEEFSASPRPCTITGTPRADRLRGTRGDDVICGLGGDDVIDGRDGDDAVMGDAGRDRIDGGDGDDTLYGGEGDDRLDGERGFDVLSGGPGADTLARAAAITSSPADDQVRRVVPQPDRAPLALEAELGDRAGVEREVAAVGGRQPDPAGGEHAQEVSVGEQRDVAAPRPARARSRGRRGRRPARRSRRPGAPSAHTLQPGRSSRISGVVRPSYEP